MHLRDQLQATLGSAYTIDRELTGGGMSRVFVATEVTLQPVRRIDVDGLSVRDYAAEAGITPNNAGVRVFRARQALRKRVVRWCASCAERGCIDCSCGEPGSAGCTHETVPGT